MVCHPNQPFSIWSGSRDQHWGRPLKYQVQNNSRFRGLEAVHYHMWRRHQEKTALIDFPWKKDTRISEERGEKAQNEKIEFIHYVNQSSVNEFDDPTILNGMMAVEVTEHKIRSHMGGEDSF
ncbi:hypothetical protein EVAR_41664_1 [Eumeta japonica]|uniref:Uncharacterized protein n=1 Tax=Eumeta variegata TaxID=151549 RepID=A0A4C1VRZ6_EUMVA|nr:hypothetical protein EVAR_41664_1 [Eumeta japonica]